VIKIVNEKKWSHILMDKNRQWILTFLSRVDPVEYDVSLYLTNEEIKEIKKEPSSLNMLLSNAKNNPDLYKERQIIPPVWP